MPFCGCWVIVIVSGSPSSSKHEPAKIGGSPTSTRSGDEGPEHWGGSLTAGTLVVVTVTSLESELPSLALNLKLSAPRELALY